MNIIPAIVALALVPQPKSIVAGEGVVPASTPVEYSHDGTIPAEGYRISVTPDGIAVASSDKAGRFYADATLRQLGTGGEEMPCVEISDAPAYRWRGMHLDVSRHFFNVSEVKRFIDQISAHKFNVMHWHLVDGQGWRLYVPSHPELALASAERQGAVVSNAVGRVLNGKEDGPFYYTEEQVRDIIAYASARNVTIVPEIEMPGHFGSVSKAHPELRCVDGDGVSIGWNEMCIGNDDAIALIEDVLDYVCRLFPGQFIHIGGDECSRKRWKQCARCQARIRAEGLAGEDDLQAWLSRRMILFVEARGKRAVGWDEYLLGDNLPKGAVGMRWRSSGGAGGGPEKFKGAAELLEAGHDLVMANARWCYLDYPQAREADPYTYTFPLTREKPWNYKPLSLVYDYSPCRDIPEQFRGKILGGEGCNWTETTPNMCSLEWKMWPRGCALAECLWLGEARPGYGDFLARMRIHAERMRAEGINVAPLPESEPGGGTAGEKGL